MLLLESPDGTVLHTGDLSVAGQRTIKGVDLTGPPPADDVMCEGTYGNHRHPSRRAQERALVAQVQQTVQRGGRVLIPAFAVGRAQEVILILKAFRASGLLAPVPLYLDGLLRTVADVYAQQLHDLQPALQN